MRAMTHFVLGYLTALFFVPFGNIPALLVWGMQLFPLIDGVLKRALKFEFFHTIYGFLGSAIVLWAVTPWWWLGIGSYALHIASDLIAAPGVAFFAPTNEKRYVAPILHADAVVTTLSLLGIILMLVKLS